MPLCYIFATCRLYTQRAHIDTYYNPTYYMLGCSTSICIYYIVYIYILYIIYKLSTSITYLNVLYTLPHHYLYTSYISLHPTYTTYTCFISCLYDSLHSVPIYYIVSIYNIYILPVKSLNTLHILPHKLDIKHLQLHKHCPCRTVVVGNLPQGHRGEGGTIWLGAVVILYKFSAPSGADIFIHTINIYILYYIIY